MSILMIIINTCNSDLLRQVKELIQEMNSKKSKVSHTISQHKLMLLPYVTQCEEYFEFKSTSIFNLGSRSSRYVESYNHIHWIQ